MSNLLGPRDANGIPVPMTVDDAERLTTLFPIKMAPSILL